MSKIKVLPYNKFSKSAKSLVNSDRTKLVLKTTNKPFIGKRIMVNWGSNTPPAFRMTSDVKVLNKFEAVKLAANKLTALTKMKEAGVKVPEFTSDINVAKTWLDNERYVVCRKLLRSNSGKGIVLAKSMNELITAPLYTKYVRKEKEYRVHVFNDEVIDYIEKKRKNGFTESTVYNKYIRSVENGWIFARENVTITDEIRSQAIKAVAALGLDFGAVDIVVSSYNSEPYVLEVNTAPGLVNTTITKYKEAILKYDQQLTRGIVR